MVNKNNPITNLDMETLAKICKGEITNWNQIGGNDIEIVMIGRDAASGTRDGFESIVQVKEECVYAEEQSSTGAVLASVQANEGAIGYISLSAVDAKITALTIDNVQASFETVQDGTYQIQRPFVFAVKKDHNNELISEFLTWSTSDETSQMIINAGAVPNKK